MKELREIISANISTLRTECGITQSKLAQVLNYSDKAVSKWERGESIPDVGVLKQIADYFGVTVDYLLEESHGDFNNRRQENLKHVGKNHFIISALSVLAVWALATVIFATFIFVPQGRVIAPWLTFIYAIPVSSVVAIVFNSIWGRTGLNYFLISVLCWSIILTVYLTLLAFGFNIWALFLVGIPAQIIVILCSGIRRTRRI
jgi:transcriptional regulator with XRE-family HTH domain